MVLVFDGAVRSLRRLAIDTVAVVVAVLAPAVYADVGRGFGTDTVFDLVVWVGVALLVRLVVRRSEDLSRQESRLQQSTVEVEFLGARVEDVTGFTPEAFFDDLGLLQERTHPDDRESRGSAGDPPDDERRGGIPVERGHGDPGGRGEDRPDRASPGGQRGPTHAEGDERARFVVLLPRSGTVGPEHRGPAEDPGYL